MGYHSMNPPAILAQPVDQTWVLPRSLDTYKLLYRQATKACVEQGLQPMDALLIAAHVLRSVGIHVPSAMEETFSDSCCNEPAEA